MGIRPAQSLSYPPKVHTEEPENSLEVLESILGGVEVTHNRENDTLAANLRKI